MNGASLAMGTMPLLKDVHVPGMVLGTVSQGRRDVEASGVCGTNGVPVTADTCFDLASVTKVVATTCLLHRLMSLGQINPDDPISHYLPWSPSTSTIRTIAYHRAGLWEWQPLYLSGKDPVTTLVDLPLRYEPNTNRHYSDLGFMLLGLLVETVTGTPLDTAFAELIAAPLNLTHTGFTPVTQHPVTPHPVIPHPVILPQAGSPTRTGDRRRSCLRQDDTWWRQDDELGNPVTPSISSSGWGDTIEQHMVATSTPYPVLFHNPSFPWRTYETIGEPNDGNAFHCFAGVAGHAGLFSSVHDLLTLLESLAHTDPLWGDCTQVYADGPDNGQAFGWRSMTATVNGTSHRMLWHPGFTGCAVGFVPGTGFAITLLTNRLLAPTPPDTISLWEKALTHVDAISEWRIP